MPKQPVLIDHDTYLLTAVADNPLYGYSETHPIPVGGAEFLEGPLNERRVLNALLGPKDEGVYYHRTGSFKAYGIVNDESNEAMLDRYEVSWEDLEEPKVLYFNMYAYGEVLAPAGFTFRRQPFSLEECEDADNWDIDSLQSRLEGDTE
jgi:hypothetical protein